MREMLEKKKKKKRKICENHIRWWIQQAKPEEVEGRLPFLNEACTSEEPDRLLAQLKKVERTRLLLVIMARSCWTRKYWDHVIPGAWNVQCCHSPDKWRTLGQKYHHRKNWCTSRNRTASSVNDRNVWQFRWWPGTFHTNKKRMSKRSIKRSAHSRCQN